MEKRTGLTAEDIWAMFAETGRQLKETDRLMQKNAEEMRESDRKLKERIERIGDKMDGMDNNIGYHAEQFFQDALAKSLAFGGIKYDFAYPNLKCEGKNGGAEFDIVLVNGTSIAIIEVKNRIHPDFVEEMAKDRIDKFRKYFKVYEHHKAYLGIAGFSFSDKVLEKAKECGIGIIRQAGDSIEMDKGKLKAY